MLPLVLADNFLAGSILSWLLPIGLLIAIAIWYAVGIRRFAGSRTPDEIPPEVVPPGADHPPAGETASGSTPR
jgi:hypothetical protein